MKKIWLVFNQNGRAPHFVHESFEAAKKEAKRLANIYPDNDFHVMESQGIARKIDVSFFTYPKNKNILDEIEDEIPF